ncbi:MAG TPA: FecR domain-containing protein [Sunxiuqinia sp.]|nr:FecR domain-containing protein [Sunxiuqinia sp.]
MDQSELQIWELLTRKLHDELSGKELEEVKQLLNDKKNQRLYQRIREIHAGAKETKPLQKANQFSSWQKIEKSIRRNSLQLNSRQFLRYAAILIAAFLFGTYFNPIFKFYKTNQYATIQVMNGQTSHLFLFDGTEVWLNSGTTFKYPKDFNTDERNVYIDGEAYFKVAHNKKLPFIVNTGKMQVEVLGTTFNVSAYSNEAAQSVVLVEGKVQINNIDGKKIADILPGQIATQTNSKKLQIHSTDPEFYTSWKDGRVTFKDERLGDIARKLERWYNVDIRFDQTDLKNYNMTGTVLLNKPIEQTTMALQLLAPIKFEYGKSDSIHQVITVIRK